MKRVNRKSDLYFELQKRLEENKQLYRESSVFSVLDSSMMRFVASHLGVNPWKVLVPASLLISLFLRLIMGGIYSEIVLRILGGP